jgi:hypothetical protein
MSKAGKILSQQATQSFSSAATISNRFNQFVAFLKENNIKQLEKVTRETVLAYADHLKSSDLSPASKQNYLSAVNVIMSRGRGDDSVRVTSKEADLEKRSGVASQYKGDVARGDLSDRTQAIVDLARSFGLRFEEASKLNAQAALSEAKETNSLTISTGTKGGQSRMIPITNDQQIATLQLAAEIQDGAKSMIDPTKSYAEHQRDCYRETSHFHGERHAYANQRYAEIIYHNLGIRISSPVLSDKPTGQRWSDYIADKAAEQGIGISPELAKEFDQSARLQLAEELGHHRVDVISAYIGGQR